MRAAAILPPAALQECPPVSLHSTPIPPAQPLRHRRQSQQYNDYTASLKLTPTTSANDDMCAVRVNTPMSIAVGGPTGPLEWLPHPWRSSQPEAWP
jgi:hypothetical protein